MLVRFDSLMMQFAVFVDIFLDSIVIEIQHPLSIDLVQLTIEEFIFILEFLDFLNIL